MVASSWGGAVATGVPGSVATGGGAVASSVDNGAGADGPGARIPAPTLAPNHAANGEPITMAATLLSTMCRSHNTSMFNAGRHPG